MTICLFTRLLWPVLLFGTEPAAGPANSPPLSLHKNRNPNMRYEALEGTYEVFENREAGSGRKIGLHFIVIPAKSPNPRPDPIFVLAGGPGLGVTGQYNRWKSSWMRHDRDIVLVDQRGTGQSNPLTCEMPGSSENLQGYLDPLFEDLEPFRECRDELQKKADLTQYTTPIAMDDLDELRAALGYERINLYGGSYGTRAALVYMRRHGDRVRTATLMGIAPISFENPLYHAGEAQRALDLTFDECAADPACAAAFPRLREEFAAVLARLDAEPAVITPRRQGTDERVTLKLTREGFTGALRYMMYYTSTGRRVPLFIHQIHEENYLPFVRQTIEGLRPLHAGIAFGMLLSVTCSEDVPRISEEEIVRETAGTFTGDGRVRRQKEVCALWPKADVPAAYGEPVRCSAPTLLFSGTLDPVTSPRFGEEAARHLPNSLHLVVPGYHGVGGPRIDEIIRNFLKRGSIEGLDTSKTSEVTLPPFALPPPKAEKPADESAE